MVVRVGFDDLIEPCVSYYSCLFSSICRDRKLCGPRSLIISGDAVSQTKLMAIWEGDGGAGYMVFN